MTSVNFCYWLKGLLEAGKPVTLNLEQIRIIDQHLSMVFVHEIDPLSGADSEKLNHIHNSTVTAGGDFHLGDIYKPDPSPPSNAAQVMRC
jgi:hypothetical protein